MSGSNQEDKVDSIVYFYDCLYFLFCLIKQLILLKSKKKVQKYKNSLSGIRNYSILLSIIFKRLYLLFFLIFECVGINIILLLISLFLIIISLTIIGFLDRVICLLFVVIFKRLTSLNTICCLDILLLFLLLTSFNFLLSLSILLIL